MEEAGYGNGYNKRPLWQWILLYVVIGAIVYGLFYYFVLAKKGGYNYSTGNTQQTQTPNQQISPTAQAPATKNAIEIANFAYSPATVTVKVGEAVTWTNQDSAGHNATSDDKSFDTGVLDTGKSRTVAFNKAGTYTYHCSVHPSMHGTIIVQ